MHVRKCELMRGVGKAVGRDQLEQTCKRPALN